MSALEVIQRTTERYRSVGDVVQSDGTLCVVNLKEYGPKAFLHEFYPGLGDRELRKASKEIGNRIPDELRSFYLKMNGFRCYYGAINLFGYVENEANSELKFRPYSLIRANESSRKPRNTIDDYLFIGSYGIDASLVYINTIDGKVYRTPRNGIVPLNSWSGFEDWIATEIPRLNQYYTADGACAMPRDAQLPGSTSDVV